MAEQQNNRCAICGTDDPNGKSHRGTWFVDHCHNTGAVRGLLCIRCNSVLGMARDRIEVLEAAITYLNSHTTAKETAA